jgi:hypothetical protein
MLLHQVLGKIWSRPPGYKPAHVLAVQRDQELKANPANDRTSVPRARPAPNPIPSLVEWNKGVVEMKEWLKGGAGWRDARIRKKLEDFGFIKWWERIMKAGNRQERLDWTGWKEDVVGTWGRCYPQIFPTLTGDKGPFTHWAHIDYIGGTGIK